MERKTEDVNHQINELKTVLESMKDILDNAYQGIVLVNNEGRIVKWNYEKLFGIKEEDVLGKPIEEVIENTRLHIVAKTGRKEICEVQRIKGRDMIASRTPIIKNGKIIGAVGTVLFKDVKEVKDLAIRLKMLENTVDKYKGELSRVHNAKYSFDNIITQNKNMLMLKETARKAAYSNSTILIQGESGTGKEYFAHAIHSASSRRHAAFIRVNCAAIPQELLESELFGYEGGAFTGAKKEGKIGKLELAHGGTLLLDEIGAMPYNMQSKLLRVLEEREFERIGGSSRIKIDMRVIASTNEDLQTAVKEGRFRSDLFYRLNVVEIEIPPLRDRLDDIPVLCEYTLNHLFSNMGFENKTVTDKAKTALSSYNWPGNVRELRNVLERAANISSGEYINLEHLPSYISSSFIMNNYREDSCLLKDVVAKAEISAIMEALKLANGSRTEAAKRLGIHRTALYKKLTQYGFDIKNF
ncbi:sigma 54-interacting transcriptional regulator [Clostridium swellfunianum]|uniref:sigma-54 interaction domain-containing protein n=1 Tax=Clostridium swellfunianum TaxID=1367462 RepID=UPI00202FEA0C|nr:sigma 54-interacting transcriptional regulator [Clostridium swellfunianum]MCM0650978.1 sigma 54-interacting transcriptional regulator [Clostridium swellfunianum]